MATWGSRRFWIFHTPAEVQRLIDGAADFACFDEIASEPVRRVTLLEASRRAICRPAAPADKALRTARRSHRIARLPALERDRVGLHPVGSDACFALRARVKKTVVSDSTFKAVRFCISKSEAGISLRASNFSAGVGLARRSLASVRAVGALFATRGVRLVTRRLTKLVNAHKPFLALLRWVLRVRVAALALVAAPWRNAALHRAIFDHGSTDLIAPAIGVLFAVAGDAFEQERFRGNSARLVSLAVLVDLAGAAVGDTGVAHFADDPIEYRAKTLRVRWRRCVSERRRGNRDICAGTRRGHNVDHGAR
jgi:hypothetical protein